MPAAVHAATVVISVAMFAAVTLIPQFVQAPSGGGHGFGVSAARTGLVIAPMAVCMLLAVPVSTRIAARARNATTFRVGEGVAAVTLLSLGAVHDRLGDFLVAGAALGTAYGFAFASLGGLVVDAVPAEQTGAATGVNTDPPDHRRRGGRPARHRDRHGGGGRRLDGACGIRVQHRVLRRGGGGRGCFADLRRGEGRGPVPGAPQPDWYTRPGPVNRRGTVVGTVPVSGTPERIRGPMTSTG